MSDLSCAVVTIATSKSTEGVRFSFEAVKCFLCLQIFNFHLVQTLNYTQGRHFRCEEALFRALEQAAQRGGEVSGDIQIPPGHDPMQCAAGEPALAVGLDDLQKSLTTLIIL